MGMLTTLLIAAGLAMDAFAVSITSGVKARTTNLNHALKVAIFFGSFQGIMPLIGWSVGIELRGLITNVDHWVAFGLLSFIGSKMIYESMKTEMGIEKINLSSLHVLLLLSIATSIDALVVGLSFAFLKILIVTPIIIIGIVTFILSFIGVYLGDKFGQFFGKRVEVLGGIVLIIIGIKILIEHLS